MSNLCLMRGFRVGSRNLLTNCSRLLTIEKGILAVRDREAASIDRFALGFNFVSSGAMIRAHEGKTPHS